MVEFGDELVLQSLRIPWLIWIQLLVMFLLLLLLYSLTLSSSGDNSDDFAAAADAPSSSSSPPPLDSRGSHSHKQQFLVPIAHQVSKRLMNKIKSKTWFRAGTMASLESSAVIVRNIFHMENCDVPEHTFLSVLCHLLVIITPLLHVRESQSVKGFIATSATRRVADEEDSIEEEDSSDSYRDHHPCSIVRLARIAFLKCLGLDFASGSSSFKEHRR